MNAVIVTRTTLILLCSFTVTMAWINFTILRVLWKSVAEMRVLIAAQGKLIADLTSELAVYRSRDEDDDHYKALKTLQRLGAGEVVQTEANQALHILRYIKSAS